MDATVIWDSCMQIHSLLRTGLFSDFAQVISSDHDAVDEIESWRQMVGLEELQARLLLTKHYGWTRANFGRMATSFEGCSFEMNSYVLMRLENDWYRSLSFEGCSNEVRFGLDCSIIGVRH